MQIDIVELEAKQAARYEKFPKNRIPFLNTYNAVRDDMINMKAWHRGQIGMTTLRERVRRTNHLPAVSEEAMLFTLKLTGWMEYEDDE